MGKQVIPTQKWSSLEFVIEGGFTPQTIPYTRLAEYMLEFGSMLLEKGATEVLHLEIREGSCSLATRFPEDDNVVHKLRNTAGEESTSQQSKHYMKLRTMVTEDNQTAYIKGAAGPILYIEPLEQEHNLILSYETYSLKEETTIDGILTLVGDKRKRKNFPGNSSSLALKSGNRFIDCTASIEQAKALGPHIYEAVRLYGMGSWKREDPSTGWQLHSLTLSSFSILDSSPLSELLASMP